MAFPDMVIERPEADRPSVTDDLAWIRRDTRSILRDTADLRATLTEFLSRKPGVSRRFVLIFGALAFIVVVSLIAAQVELRSRLGLP